MDTLLENRKGEWFIGKSEKAVIDLLINHDTDKIIEMIKNSKKMNPSDTLEMLLDIRRELGLKIQDVVNGIRYSSDEFVVGQLWIPKEDIRGGFFKGKEYPITHVFDTEVVVDGVARMPKEAVRENFVKAPFKNKK